MISEKLDTLRCWDRQPSWNGTVSGCQPCVCTVEAVQPDSVAQMLGRQRREQVFELSRDARCRLVGIGTGTGVKAEVRQGELLGSSPSSFNKRQSTHAMPRHIDHLERHVWRP